MTVMFTMLYYWNGTTLLSKLRGNEAVGNYSAAFRLAMGLAFAGLAFSGAVFPLLSRLFTTNRQRFTQTLELALRYMLLLVLPIAVFCSALASPIITIVYGPEYSEAAGVFGIVAWWGSLACLNSLLSNYFLAVNRPAVVTVQTGVSLGICVVGNILLIPSLGAQGSAYAIVVAEAIGVLCLSTVMLVGPDGLKLHRYSLAIVRTVVALVPASVALRAAIRWNMPAGIAVGAAAYLLVLVFVQGIERRDVTFLRALVSRNDA